MSDLQAGAARIALEPKVGTDLVGYADKQETVGIHDPLHARALVLDDGNTTLALCSIEVCFFTSQNTSQMRALVAERCPIPPERVLFCATHTHAAPAFFEAENWKRSPAESAADAVAAAYQAKQPARVSTGFGQLQGYSINRRFMNRPVDPSIGVIRIDSTDGQPIAILGNFGNHAVVMGYDNQYVSGDWPGLSSARLEADMGNGFVALFSQGGAGDVNPLTETVRQRLAAGYPVEAIGSTSTLYGSDVKGHPNGWNIGDRGGGVFIEAETIALAYNAEVMRVWRAIDLRDSAHLWVETVMVDVAPAPDEPPIPDDPPVRTIRERFQRIFASATESAFQMEVMLLGIGDTILVGHPGETFSENAVALRKIGQQMGIAYPLLISYANGWLSYLVPENAYAEGGYEVAVARSMGLSRRVQDRIMTAIMPHLQAHVGR